MSTERVEVAEVFLTRKEVAGRLNVSTRTVDRYIADGELAFTRLGAAGRLVRIPESAVAAFTDTPTATPPRDGGPHAPATGSQPGGGGTPASAA